MEYFVNYAIVQFAYLSKTGFGRACKIDVIPDDQDPLKNPQAEAARRADRESGNGT